MQAADVILYAIKATFLFALYVCIIGFVCVASFAQELDCSSNTYKYSDVIHGIEQEVYDEAVGSSNSSPFTRSWFFSQCKSEVYYGVFNGLFVYRLEYPMRGGESIIVVDDSTKVGYKLGGWGSRNSSDIDKFVYDYFDIDAADSELLFLAKATYQLFLTLDTETVVIDSSNYDLYSEMSCCILYPTIARSKYDLESLEFPSEYVQVTFSTIRLKSNGKNDSCVVVVKFYPDRPFDYIIVQM